MTGTAIIAEVKTLEKAKRLGKKYARPDGRHQNPGRPLTPKGATRRIGSFWKACLSDSPEKVEKAFGVLETVSPTDDNLALLREAFEHIRSVANGRWRAFRDGMEYLGIVEPKTKAKN